MSIWDAWKLYQQLRNLLAALNLQPGQSTDVPIPDANQPTLTLGDGRVFKFPSIKVLRSR